MATNPIDGVASLVTMPGTIPPMPAVARILARYDRAKLEAFISVAIDLIDTLDGPEDAEDGDPAEAIGDERDCATTEWHGLHWRAQRSGAVMPIDTRNRNIVDEGDEDDDAAGQYDEDEYTGPRPRGHGPGCTISDPDRGETDIGAV